MRTIEVSLFQFDELTDKAKDKARQWYRDCSVGDNYFAEPVREDATEIAKLLGITFKQRPYKTIGGAERFEPCIWFSGFSSQGDGACFEGSYEHKADCLTTVTAHAPLDEKLHAIAKEMQEAGAGLKAVIVHNGRYYHALTMEFDFINVDDEEAEIEVGAEKRMTEAFRAFANWIYRQLEDAYEYDNSDEHVDDTIRANEYEFHDDGTRARAA